MGLRRMNFCGDTMVVGALACGCHEKDRCTEGMLIGDADVRLGGDAGAALLASIWWYWGSSCGGRAMSRWLRVGADEV